MRICGRVDCENDFGWVLEVRGHAQNDFEHAPVQGVFKAPLCLLHQDAKGLRYGLESQSSIEFWPSKG